MARQFKTIGLMGRPRSSESVATLNELIELLSPNYQLILEENTASLIPEAKFPSYDKSEFGQYCDIAIVVGGDGSILNAARAVVPHHTPVLGVNRGRLGFLTDIHPSQIQERILDVLAGNYFEENRFLLRAEVWHKGKLIHKDIALNDVVLLPGEYSHMIEFDIFINHQLVCKQRADGQIIATPTGSTAYALSGGGPIVHPKLDAIVLVPMFPHTLSSRPIVIDSHSEIEFKINENNETSPQISCDGLDRIRIKPGDTLRIHRYEEPLTVLHPKDYNYYETLRSKLHWERGTDN